MQVVEHDDVVLGVRVLRIKAERVRRRHELRIAAAEDAVGAGIVDVPGELLGHDVDLDRILVLLREVRPLVPRWDRQPCQEDDFDDGHAELAVGGDVRARADVVRARVALGVEAVEAEEEVRPPHDEEDSHEPVREDDQVIDLMSVRGGVDGPPLVQELSHQKTPRWMTRMESRRARRARARRQKAMNIAPRPIWTKPMMPRRKKTPLFVPFVMAELGSPKQTGQADAIAGARRRTAVRMAPLTRPSATLSPQAGRGD